MSWKKSICFIFTPIVLFLSAPVVFAQQTPYITYNTNSANTFVWYVGKPVSEAPTNTGGPVTAPVAAYLMDFVTYNTTGPGLFLPPGITFDRNTGILSGTPAAPWPLTPYYAISTFNDNGPSNNFLFSIEVIGIPIKFDPLPNKTVCDADFSAVATSAAPLFFSSSNPDVATVTDGIIHIAGPGKTIIKASNSEESATDTLIVLPSVTPSVTISPDSLDSCPDALATYMATAINGGDKPTYQWQVNGLDAGTNTATFSSSSLKNNDKITCTLTSNASCPVPATAVSNTAIFTLAPPIIASVNITSPVGAICASSTVTFAASANTATGSLAYQWQVNGKNEGTNSPVFITKNLSNADVVTCTLTVTGKCNVKTIASNPITINLSPEGYCELIIPNTFTPNGDGINDYWDITLLQKYNDCTVTIFNRYGTIVYKSAGYAIPWDGTYHGKQLPVGTYYYIIDLKSGADKVAGSVTIIR